MNIFENLPDSAWKDLNHFRASLLAHPENEGQAPPANNLKPAAVLIPLFWQEDEWHLVFTRRSNHVNDHKGQVSFPGGRVEEGDKNLICTALREAEEEILLQSDDAEIIGFLPDYISISDYFITPVVGIIRNVHLLRPNSSEVDSIIMIPVSFFSQQENYRIGERVLPNGEVSPVIFYKAYNNEIVWGITAQITQILIKMLQI